MRLRGPAERALEDEQLERCFPSRAKWIRPRKSERELIGGDLNRRIVLNTVLTLRARERNTEWHCNLMALVKEIRDRALSLRGHYFDPPRIVAIPKPGKPNIYRPLALFSLVDSAILGLTSSYLRHCIDADLLPCALAFRIATGAAPAPNHHDAVAQILKYNERFQRPAKWVAECDISAFYDSVSHSIARDALALAIERANRRAVALDDRASRVFAAYLSCYSFPHAVLGKALRRLQEKDRRNDFNWDVDKLKKFYADPFRESIGIPQGGALSNVIANLVLDYADRRVVGDGSDLSLLYLRYCDDMVLIHTRKRDCEAAFARYTSALNDLKLPAHESILIAQYGKTFWKAKSKQPFRWASDATSVPWLAFVGYHVHYDNWLRLRPSSVAKEIGKQAELARRIIRAIPSIRGRGLSSKQVMHRLRQRLIAMSVGRRRIGSDLSVPEDFCWASGFRLLMKYPHSGRQLRHLDRSREKQIARVRRALSFAALSSAGSTVTKQKVPPFYGAPFSYFRQFAGKVVHSLLKPRAPSGRGLPAKIGS